MKSWKVSIISLLLSAWTLGTVYTQSAPKLAFSVNSGIARSGLPMQVGFRVGLGQHLAGSAQFGTAPWRYKESNDQHIEQGVTLKHLKVRGNEAFSLDLRAYTNPGQSGFYGGVGFFNQSISIETKTKLRSPRTGSSLAGSATSGLGFIIGGFFDIIDSITRNNTIERTDYTKVNAFTIDLGYAHVFENNGRLEFGVRHLKRNIDGIQYFVPTFDNPKAFDLDKIAKANEVSLEVRYVRPIL